MYVPSNSWIFFDAELFEGVLKLLGLLEQLLPLGMDQLIQEHVGLHLHHSPEKQACQPAHLVVYIGNFGTFWEAIETAAEVVESSCPRL